MLRRIVALAALAAVASSPLVISPARAGRVQLCSQTTGTSPCPLPGSKIALGDTLEVSAANVVTYFLASPGGAFADSGLFLVQPGGTFAMSGWAWPRVFASAQIDNRGAWTNDAILQIEDDGTMWNRTGATLVTSSDFTIYDDGRLVNDGLVENNLYLYTLIDPSNDPPGDPDNPTLDNRGTFLNHAGADLPLDGECFNSGTLVNEAGAFFSNTGLLTNTGTLVIAGPLTNTLYDAGRARIVNDGDFRVAATGSVDRSTAVKPFGSYWQTSGRTVVNGPVKQTLVYVMGGALEGGASLQGVVRVGDGAGSTATLSPGDSLDAIATLAITGSLGLGADARTVADLAAGGLCDLVTATTRDTLRGELALRLSTTSPPAVGDTLTILTAGTAITGTFASVTVDGVPNAGAVAVLYEAKRVRVVVLALVGVETVATLPEAARLAVRGGPAGRELALDLPRAARVRLTLHDVLGRRVALVADGELAPGAHRFALEARALPVGVLFARASVSDAAGTTRLAARFASVR